MRGREKWMRLREILSATSFTIEAITNMSCGVDKMSGHCWTMDLLWPNKSATG